MALLQTMNPGAPLAQTKKQKQEIGHRVRVSMALAAAGILVVSIGVYGANYYILPEDERPFSPKYELLRPSGSIGIKLGILGTVLFFIIFLYALRKVIPWLGRVGTAKHWMDFHVIAGITAPILIAYHASFKFQGIAGVAFWIMLAVAVSGVIGRYLYAQIPRSLSAAELSLAELETKEQEFAEALLSQSVFTKEQLTKAIAVPSAEQIRKMGALRAIGGMIGTDILLFFRMAKLRRTHASLGAMFRSLGGILSSGNHETEQVVRLVREKVSLSKRTVFLGQAQRVFHLWHVIHRPFSYTFAVLAIIHIVVVVELGFISAGLQ